MRTSFLAPVHIAAAFVAVGCQLAAPQPERTSVRSGPAAVTTDEISLELASESAGSALLETPSLATARVRLADGSTVAMTRTDDGSLRAALTPAERGGARIELTGVWFRGFPLTCLSASDWSVGSSFYCQTSEGALPGYVGTVVRQIGVGSTSAQFTLKDVVKDGIFQRIYYSGEEVTGTPVWATATSTEAPTTTFKGLQVGPLTPLDMGRVDVGSIRLGFELGERRPTAIGFLIGEVSTNNFDQVMADPRIAWLTTDGSGPAVLRYTSEDQIEVEVNSLELVDFVRTDVTVLLANEAAASIFTASLVPRRQGPNTCALKQFSTTEIEYDGCDANHTATVRNGGCECEQTVFAP